MSNAFINGLREMSNYTYTENNAVSLRSTLDAVYDLFALGAAYRQRSEEDIINLFKKAYRENAELAMKCLFYIRDAREGQGERRFFRVCMNWLAKSDDREAAKRNLQYVSEFGRWDDLYCFIDTPLQNDALEIMRQQIALDMSCKTPSLLAKWLKSINTSSAESRRLANITREYFGMTHKQYRRTLSILRERINVLEKLMSAGEWDKIEFDKIPSRAGLIYRNAFARRDVLRERYEKFIMDKNTKVNAKVLYPYECVKSALDHIDHKIYGCADKLERAAINKYWDNLRNYFDGAAFNGMALVDTSGSMTIKRNSIAPINISIALGLYCAEKCSGPYAGHFITFESNPHFIEVEGKDFVEKVENISNAPWGNSTNVEKAFDLMLETAIRNNLSQKDIPENLIVISDQEFDQTGYNNRIFNTLCDGIKNRWKAVGYEMPHLVFWNCNARHDLIPMKDDGNVTFVSGASPVIFEMIMSGKKGIQVMKETLECERYSCIH